MNRKKAVGRTLLDILMIVTPIVLGFYGIAYHPLLVVQIIFFAVLSVFVGAVGWIIGSIIYDRYKHYRKGGWPN